MAQTDRPTAKQRLRYTVDHILSKGVFGVFLLAVVGTLLILFVLVPILLAIQILVTHKGSWTDIPGMIWADFAQVFNVVIFNQRTEPEMRDSSTFMVMLQATAIAQALPAEDRPAIVTELVEPKLRKLCKPGGDDIVVDSEMVALMTAQLSENPRLLTVLVDLCDANGSEIYLKKVGLYATPRSMNYATLVEAARRRGEIAIGYRRAADATNKKANFGITLNHNKNTVIDVNPADQLIVVAEDQF